MFLCNFWCNFWSSWSWCCFRFFLDVCSITFGVVSSCTMCFSTLGLCSMLRIVDMTGKLSLPLRINSYRTSFVHSKDKNEVTMSKIRTNRRVVTWKDITNPTSNIRSTLPYDFMIWSDTFQIGLKVSQTCIIPRVYIRHLLPSLWSYIPWKTAKVVKQQSVGTLTNLLIFSKQ